MADAAALGLSVFPLDYDPATEDLVWARLDPSAARGHDHGSAGWAEVLEESLAGRSIVFAEPGQVLIALKPDESAKAHTSCTSTAGTAMPNSLPPTPVCCNRPPEKQTGSNCRMWVGFPKYWRRSNSTPSCVG